MAEVKNAICSICSHAFAQNKNLYQHMRRTHNFEPRVPGKIICPLKCAEKLRTQKDLRDHLKSFHLLTVEYNIEKFPDFETFETWKKNYESTSGYSYICRISEKPRSGGQLKSNYICHRSGIFRSHSRGHRSLKKGGSHKIGSHCPAQLEVIKSIRSGRVRVIHWKTHIGHDADIIRTSQNTTCRVKNSVSISFPVCVILPAAGTGERMGLNIPKQYIPIYKKPLICYTVEAFLKIPFIHKVVVVAAHNSLDKMLEILSKMCALQGEKVMVTEGSSFRHRSIESGLTALKTCETLPEVVVIHDGVRPFVSEEIVQNVALAAKEFGASGVICPLVSTVISVGKKNFLDSSLDRNKYKASEMPQAFQFKTICEAYSKSTTYDFEYGTECLDLVQKYSNVKPKLLPGTTNLWKVTHRKDIYTAAAMIKENQSVGIVSTKPIPAFLPILRMSLNKKFKSVHLGKVTDVNICTQPNLVLIQRNLSPFDVIEQMNTLDTRQKITELRSIVNVLYMDFDKDINFLELQKQAKENAKKLEAELKLIYYVMWEKTATEESFPEKSELITSLLFDSNSHISGTIFLS